MNTFGLIIYQFYLSITIYNPKRVVTVFSLCFTVKISDHSKDEVASHFKAFIVSQSEGRPLLCERTAE